MLNPVAAWIDDFRLKVLASHFESNSRPPRVMAGMGVIPLTVIAHKGHSFPLILSPLIEGTGLPHELIADR